jgi:hypothetical protein
MKRVILGFAAITLLALACGEEESVTGPNPTPEATTPVNVLYNVEVAFNRNDIKILIGVLGEGFVFYFDPRDIGTNPPGSEYVIPESWSYEEFWPVAWNMFREAYSINLSITTNTVGTPGANETTYQADYVKISLLVMVTELNGFIADGGYCNFEFERYEAASGKKYWRLAKWWDRTSQHGDEYPGLSPASFGKVLAMYR